MTRRDESVRSGHDAVIAEHRELRQLLVALRDAEQRSELLGRLGAFRDTAAAHFANEEADGGFYESVLLGAPRHQRVLEDLRDEHGAMLRDLDALALRARDCDDAELEQVRGAVRALTDRLEQHECRENEILLEVMNTDLGAGD